MRKAKLSEHAQKIATEKKEVAYGVKLRRANKKNEYISNVINGRYYLARYNMMAQQVIDNKIVEVIDGAPKTKEYMRAELALVKMQAIRSLRTAHFSRLELKKDFEVSEEEIIGLENDYYNGKIIREEYDEEFRQKNKAEFVNTSED